MCSPLHFGGFLDLSGSEGRIGDGSDVPRASHLRRQFAPLCIFSLMLFLSSRRYVSHPSTRPLTLLPLSAPLCAGRTGSPYPASRAMWHLCPILEHNALRAFLVIVTHLTGASSRLRVKSAVRIDNRGVDLVHTRLSRYRHNVQVQARTATTIAVMITPR
jgi:hypothetical protein